MLPSSGPDASHSGLPAASHGEIDTPPLGSAGKPVGKRLGGEEGTRSAWPVLVLALPAFVAVWSGWVGLGELTGFGVVKLLPGIWDSLTLNTAITLPVGVETYAAYAMTVWLANGHERSTRVFAKWSAVGSLVLGACGQVAYHLMTAAHVTSAPWWITTVVACLPVAVLGMGAALAHLVHIDKQAHAAAETARAEAARTVEEERTRAAEAEAVRAAREAEDAAHKRALEASELAHRQQLEAAAQAAEIEARKTAQTVSVEPSAAPRTARTGKRPAGGSRRPARQAHTASDLRRRADAKEGFKQSVRDGAPWDNARVACALFAVTDPDQKQLRAASARRSEWRREVEAEPGSGNVTDDSRGEPGNGTDGVSR